eukprot:6205126-Pleurochrysis_carterae.AAC.2
MVLLTYSRRDSSILTGNGNEGGTIRQRYVDAVPAAASASCMHNGTCDAGSRGALLEVRVT